MQTKLARDVRYLKIHALVATLFCGWLLFTAFTETAPMQATTITTNRIIFVDSTGRERARMGVQSGNGANGVLFFDSAGKGRVRLGANIGKGSFAGLVFYNEDQTEAGVLMHNGKRNEDGTINAASLLTMDQFKSDEVIRLVYDQQGGQKRQGLIISDQPDSISREGQQLLNDLARALQSAQSVAEAQAIRREYLAKLPAKDIVARRLFAGRDIQRASVVTLSDPKGNPRLQLKVDSLGQASIVFLDSAGRAVRTITP